MCNCISQVEEKVLNELKTMKEAVGIVNSAKFKQKAFNLTNGGSIRSYNEVEYEMTNKKVNGTLGATRNYTISIYHSYCPFCGEKIS